jgi:hypothetical protein
MKKAVVLLILITPISFCLAQKDETFDITSYQSPTGWKKESTDYALSFVTTNEVTQAWCRMTIYKSIASSGNFLTDFNSEWNALIAKSYTDAILPSPEATTEDGWTSQAGVAKFQFNNQDAASMLTTVTGYGVEVSIVVLMNSDEFMPAIESFLASIDLQKPTPTQINSKQNTTAQNPPAQTNKPLSFSKFAFNTTNFDDGWTATEQAEWAQITKGSIKVLVHYPNKNADAYNSDLMEGLKNAWNVLVAPRYSNGSNFEFKPVTGWQSIEFAEADLVEMETNKTIHVVLFKINYSSGDGKYMEFITPDKKTFEQEFGAYHQESYGWEKMEKMSGYNKFAVAVSDLNGKWTNQFSGLTQYVNASTGASAGADTHSSAQNFVFGPGNTYKWDLAVASGMVGNIKFQNVKSNGKFTMPNNWQINFSDMEGKPKTYNAYFSCIRGARILWLQDTGYGGYSGYGKAE